MTDQSLLAELTEMLRNLGIPYSTSTYPDDPPAEFVVLYPMFDDFANFADDTPGGETQTVQISLFSNANPRETARQIGLSLLARDIYVEQRQTMPYDDLSKTYQYIIDVSKYYNLEDLTNG